MYARDGEGAVHVTLRAKKKKRVNATEVQTNGDNDQSDCDKQRR